MKLKDLKIGTQLTIGMGTILVLVAILGGTAWYQANDLWQETKDLYEHPLQVRRALNTLAVDILTMHRDMKDLVMSDSEPERQSIIQAIDASEADATLQFEILYDRYLGSRKDIDEIRTAFVSWKPIRTETIRLVRIGKVREAFRRTKVNGVGGEQIERLLNGIQNMINGARDRADNFYADARNEKDTMLMQLWIIFAAILLLILGVSYVLLKNIRNPLAELTSLTEQFGQGRLDARSRYVSANEFGALAASFNTLAATIESEWLNKESAARLMETLRESNAYLENLINCANAPIIVWDRQFRITRFNHAFELLTGSSEAEVIGQSLEMLFPPALAGDSMALIRKTLTGERWDTVEIKILHRDQSVRTLLWNSATLFSADGQTPMATIAQGQDITERKQGEEALIQITDRLSLAARAGGVGIWDYDTVNNILVWDEQMYRLYGITADRFSGAYESWRAGLHPDDTTRGDAEIQLALSGEKDFDTEFRVVWPDGAIRTIRALAIVQRDSDGKPLRMIGTNWDITTQKQAEEALRQSEEKHRQLIENSHDIIYTLTADGIFIFVSPAWTLLLGHPVTSVAGHPFQEFVHPDDISGCMVWLQKVIETGQRQEGVEYRVRHFNGSWYWHTSSAVPLKDKTGTIIGFEGTARDVTERRRAEEESRRLSSIVLHSRELMNLTAPDGTMIFLNDAGKKMLGISEEEVAQTTIMQVIPEHLLDKVKQEVLPAIVRDGYWEGELQYRNVKTGGLTDVHATTFRIADPATGVVEFLANVSLDITDRKRAEEAISAKNKEMENYLYIASHDLRSPLVNIQGFSQRLQKQADSIKAVLADCALPAATKAGIDAITDGGIPKTLNFIFSNVTKMDVLLNGLLHLSRTGRAVMAIKEIDIHQLFQTIIANFNFQLTQLDAIITAKDIPSCYGDENLLNQLFSNIIGNAIKYHDKNRRLVIEITARKEFRKVVYSIRDTGLGMEARHLERIWDIFYRVDPTLTDTGEGLGLSSSKRIAEKHHGRVWAESEAGKGSVFYVELQTTEFSEFQ